MQEQSINYTFKIFYALVILFITAGHAQYGGFSLFYELVLLNTFHLAAFVFASGYFYKFEYENCVTDFILRKFKHLIVPMYLWNIFYAFLIIFFKSYNIDLYFGSKVTFSTLVLQPLDYGRQFTYNLGSWFVVPLFMVQVYNVIIRKFFSQIDNKEIWLTIIAIFLGCAGLYMADHGMNQHFSLCLNRMLYFLPFYQLGILYKKYESFDRINNVVYFSAIILTELVVLYNHNGVISYIQVWCKFEDGYFYPFFTGLLGIAFWLRISKILTPILSKSRIVNLLADNTYSIMVNQFLGFMLLKGFFAVLHKYTYLCSSFNIEQFKHNIWYYYTPHNLSQMLILYVLAGLIVPILMQMCVSKMWINLTNSKFYQLLFCKSRA